MFLDSELTIALVAGIFATFNPCGFAMLPAYLTFIVIGTDKAKSRKAILKDALSFSLFMGVGILAIFALFAAVVMPFASSVQKYLPLLTLGVGSLLTVGGVSLLLGKNFFIKKLWSPSISPTGSILTYSGYGATFALGSISCTIGPFLAITNAALATSDILRILITYISYGLGITATIVILSIATALSNDFFRRHISRFSRIINQLSSILLVAVGLYLLYFAWYELKLASSSHSQDPVMTVAFRFQGWVINSVSALLKLLHLLN